MSPADRAPGEAPAERRAGRESAARETHPPRLLRFLLARATEAEQRDWLLADLHEEFEEVRRDDGRQAARRWYRWQALRSIGHGLLRRLDHFRPPSPRPSRNGRRPLLESWLHDLAAGARALWRAPGFTLVGTAILALGIAANTAVFSLVSPFLFRPLPYENADRLVHLFETDARLGWLAGTQIRQSPATVADWTAQASSFEAVGAYYYSDVNIAGGDAEPERLTIARLSPAIPSMFGVDAARGRWFSVDEGAAGADPVVVLSDGLWQRRFGGDAGTVGETVRIDGVAHRIVGIAQPSFNFPYGDVQMWAPFRPAAGEQTRDERFLLVVARLAEGVSREQARAELAGVHAALVEAYPDDYRGTGVRIAPLREALIFFYDLLQVLMLMLLTSVAFVLLLVCANVANLTLARGLGRRRELAVRSALGAGRWRLGRQLLCESLVLAAVSGAFGALLAVWIVSLAAPAIPANIFRVGSIAVDPAALGYTFVVSLAAALAVGALPALQLTRSDLAGRLRDATATAGPRRRRLSGLLVIAQVASALVLGVAAATTVAATREMGAIELGFQSEGVLSTSLLPPTSDYPDRAEIEVFYEQLLARVRGLPGVEEAAVADLLPAGFADSSVQYRPQGSAADSESQPPQATRFRVTPGYFSTMGIALLEGRAFEDSDRFAARRVIVVNRTLQQQLWPDESALGRRLTLEDGDGGTEATVVGVVDDSLGGILFLGMQPQIFVPWAQQPSRRVHLVARSNGDAAELAGPVRNEVRGLAPDLPLGAFTLLDDLVDEAVAPLRMTSWLISGFGLFALLLAAIGIYGVVAYAAGRRTREIGLRMALGARPADVRRLMLRQGGWLVAAGILVGLALSMAVTLLVWAAAAEANPGDASGEGWWLPLLIAVVLALTALVAGWLPARRAARTDPVVALRHD